MYAPLIAHFASSGFFVLREVHTHQGFVDIVAVELDEKGLEARRDCGITGSMSSASLIRAWQSLPPAPKAISIDEWSSLLSIQPTTLRGLARELQKLGLIEESSRAFKARFELPSIVRRVICCEAKLNAWQKGARQAYGHRFYAHQSYLALARVPSTLDFELLHARQVGLLRVEAPQVTLQKEAPVLFPEDRITLQQLEELAWSRFSIGQTNNYQPKVSASS